MQKAAVPANDAVELEANHVENANLMIGECKKNKLKKIGIDDSKNI